MPGDLLSLIETAYASAPDTKTWVERLADAALGILDEGRGVSAFLYKNDRDRSVAVHHYTQRGNWSDGLAKTLRGMIDELSVEKNSPDLAHFFPRSPRAASGSQLFAQRLRIEHQLKVPLWRATAILGGDVSGAGVALSANLAKEKVLPRATQQAWVRVATHLASAYRLRRQNEAAVDAILRPDGRVSHAEASATEERSLAALQSATQAIDRARGRLRRAAPDEALATWRALVSGQWSLVDHFDTDGRRYVVAKRNAPETAAWSKLTERELQIVAYAAQGQGYKLIAYGLGVSIGCVSSHMRSAARKVGAPSRIALVQAYRRAEARIREPCVDEPRC